MIILLVGVVLDIAQILGLILVLVFLCYLSGIDPNSWIASLPTSLSFLRGLGLRLISEVVIRLCLFLDFVRSLIAIPPIGVVLIFFDQ